MDEMGESWWREGKPRAEEIASAFSLPKSPIRDLVSAISYFLSPISYSSFQIAS